MSNKPDVIWIEAAEDALHKSGRTHILASEKHVDWLAQHIEHMASMDPAERVTFLAQFDGVGLYGTDMAAAMLAWVKENNS